MKFLLSFVFILPVWIFGQSLNGFTKITKDSVAIKWLPNNFTQYKLLLEGASVYRIEASEGANPATLDFSKGLIKKITSAKERYQTLQESIPEEDKFLTLLSPFYERSNDAEEENFAFGTAVIENVINPKFQFITGNIFVDKSYIQGKSYYYKIVIQNLPALYIFVNTSVTTNHGKIPSFNLSLDQKKTAEVIWDYQAIKKIAFGFNVFHAIDDTSSYSNLLNETYLPFRSDVEKKDKSATIRHEEPAPGHFHFYRIVGLDVFGSPSIYSEWKKIYVPKLIKDWVQIDSVVAKEELRIIQGHVFQNKPTSLIHNISLLRSSDKDSNYVFMETRNYTDSLPIFRISGKKSDDHYYYKLIIYNEDDTVYSLPYYFFTLDQKPPQPPTTIIGTVDSTGIVHLSWVAPPDDDIRGYRVFRGNAPDEDFVEQTTMLSTELSFNDTVRLDNLSSEVFYYIRSVDMNYNNSFSSDTVLLLKPDTIPPISAVLYDVIVSDTIFLVKWINSDSKDIQFNLLLRNSAERTDTLYSWADTSSFFIDSQLIPGQGYSYFIQTFDKSKNSSTTQGIYKFYEPGYRKALSNVKVKVDTKNKGIEFRWKKPDDTVFQYVIYRAKDDEKLLPLKSIENPDNLIFNDSRVSLNTKYRYSIKYINQSGIHSIPVIIEVVYQ
jgi:fibronectin type 3 domain-containing protein